MRLPPDTPIWVDKILSTIQDNVESKLALAKTTDETLKASGAFTLWKNIKSEVELEAVRQTDEIRRRNMRLTEHVGNTGN